MTSCIKFVAEALNVGITRGSGSLVVGADLGANADGRVPTALGEPITPGLPLRDDEDGGLVPVRDNPTALVVVTVAEDGAPNAANPLSR